MLQFFSWGNFQPVGKPLASPRWLSWDPDVSMAALAYSESIALCSTRPSFGPFATLPLPVSLPALSYTMRVGSTAKVLAECML